jgi:hypothetical protein
MKQLFVAILLLMTLASFDNTERIDDFKFGYQYNSVRLKFGVPLISKNMLRQDEYGSWVVYNLDKEPLDKPYHYSKAICAYDDDKVYNEIDVYRKSLDDTTIIQLDINILYDWDKQTIVAQGNYGKLDKRSFTVKAEDYLKPNPPSFPRYEWKVFDLAEIDKLLKSWQLSRRDTD